MRAVKLYNPPSFIWLSITYTNISKDFRGALIPPRLSKPALPWNVRQDVTSLTLFNPPSRLG